MHTKQTEVNITNVLIDIRITLFLILTYNIRVKCHFVVFQQSGSHVTWFETMFGKIQTMVVESIQVSYICP